MLDVVWVCVDLLRVVLRARTRGEAFPFVELPRPLGLMRCAAVSDDEVLVTLGSESRSARLHPPRGTRGRAYALVCPSCGRRCPRLYWWGDDQEFRCARCAEVSPADDASCAVRDRTEREWRGWFQRMDAERADRLAAQAEKEATEPPLDDNRAGSSQRCAAA